MNKKAFLILVSAIALTSGIVGYNNIQKEYETMDELTLANIEALTNYEKELDHVEAQCGGTSPVYCKATCKKCGATYLTRRAYGPLLNTRGKCEDCESTDFF